MRCGDQHNHTLMSSTLLKALLYYQLFVCASLRDYVCGSGDVACVRNRVPTSILLILRGRRCSSGRSGSRRFYPWS